MTLYFLHYNNYYNRIVKKFDSLASYLVSPYYDNTKLENTNFNPNDGVNTEHVANVTSFSYDYMIAAEGNVINSRWFVIEATRLRTGQYKLLLRRDVVVDNYDDIIEAPCFIEKATLDNSDPMIFNSENMSFNQIKTSETLLKDETGCAWVVGYIPRNSFSTATPINSTIIAEDAADLVYTNKSDIPIYSYLNLPYYGKPILNQDLKMLTRINRTEIQRCEEIAYNPYLSTSNFQNKITIGTSGYFSNSELTNVGENSIVKNMSSANTDFLNLIPEYTSYSGKGEGLSEEEYKSFESKIIYISTEQKYYKVNMNKSILRNSHDVVNVTSELGLLWASKLNLVCANGTPITGTPTNEGTGLRNTFAIDNRYYSYTFTLDEIIMGVKTVLDNDRYHLIDSPYDMFCIPYSDSLKIYENGTQILTANKSLAINMATEIALDAGAGSVYDVQLLPYCPVRYMIKSDGTFDINNSKVHYITDEAGTTNKGIILWATTSAFTLDIDHNVSVTNPKIENETEMYRLVSPNFNGQFEFNPAKNGGVTKFNIDCNYKPFNPYIHINPDFGLLYGQDFNDARGLICNGDFSLPQVTSAWADYELGNKNYLNSFNRSIEHMEVNNSVQKTREIVSGVAGGVTGALAGAGSGSVFGPVGSIVGGIAGGITSAAGAGADMYLNDKLRNEALDYAKDNFGYQLGNIKAIPNSLAKTSAFTYNNKIFPLLEHYKCTDEEKEALENKILYNGMTVMKIGKISDFIRPTQSYIKGQIIRLPDLQEDFHYAKEIANEINKGVFI